MSSLKDLLQYSDTSGSDEEDNSTDSNCEKLVLPTNCSVTLTKELRKEREKATNKTELRNRNSKRKISTSLLPLPTSLLALSGSEDQCPGDDIEAHSGRKRSFPHVAGDWPSSVFMKVDLGINMCSITKKLCDHLKNKLPSIQMIPQCDQHLSLSRTVSLRHYWIDPLVSKLGDCITACNRFALIFNEFEVYTNDEKTRSFFALKTMNNHDKLVKLVNQIDEIFDSFGLDCYYKDPSFHVSFAWTLGDVIQEQKSTIDAAKDLVFGLEENEIPSALVKMVSFKTGNKIHTFQLANKISEL